MLPPNRDAVFRNEIGEKEENDNLPSFPPPPRSCKYIPAMKRLRLQWLDGGSKGGREDLKDREAGKASTSKIIEVMA